MNLLFVCSRNQWRSPTAEQIFNKRPYNTRSAGTAGSARIKLSEKLIIWADLIFVMEKKHKTVIQERFSTILNDKLIIVLDISDDYKFMDQELVEMLKLAVNPYLKLT